MNIEILENKLESVSDKKYLDIFQLIINAVSDYPLYNLTDTNLYFEEIKKITKSDNITLFLLEKTIQEDPYKGDENNIWFISSLSSMLDAFDLMRIYKISFEEVINKIESLK